MNGYTHAMEDYSTVRRNNQIKNTNLSVEWEKDEKKQYILYDLIFKKF